MIQDPAPTVPETLAAYPCLTKIAGEVLANWPEHATFLAMRFADREDPTLPLSEEMARLVLKLMRSKIPSYCDGYRWICETFVHEDLFFRRHGRYRLSSFAEAYEQVYARQDYMDNYLKGILLSQILWANQAHSFQFYVDRFLAKLPVTADYLEVGPGHGLLMYFASQSLAKGTVTGWDASQSSIDMTRQMLETMNVSRPCRLELGDVQETPPVTDSFDAVAVSEVLEHLERPEAALRTVHRVLKKAGLAFFNVPVNSPAPDHIYLWRSPEEVEDLVRNSGFTIVDHAAVACTGYDLERAKRRKVTINSLIVAQRA
jgi:ubiquinone/menaquinone biosynthesis C-methylase UbiE